VLYSSLKEDANPTLETLLAIINALGLKLKAERAA
jgi:DNA-binding phage protein